MARRTWLAGLGMLVLGVALGWSLGRAGSPETASPGEPSSPPHVLPDHPHSEIGVVSGRTPPKDDSMERLLVPPASGPESGKPAADAAYQRALERATLPEPTGNADVDRRNALRHIIEYSPLYDSPEYDGPPLPADHLAARPEVNPTGKTLNGEQLLELRRVIDSGRDGALEIWQERLALEREALLRAVDAGSFEWFGPVAYQHDPSLSASQQQLAFQQRMNDTWGPMGKDWTCVMTSARGESLTAYVTRASAPELFAAIDRCLELDRRAWERARRYIETLP